MLFCCVARGARTGGALTGVLVTEPNGGPIETCISGAGGGGGGGGGANPIDGSGVFCCTNGGGGGGSGTIALVTTALDASCWLVSWFLGNIVAAESFSQFFFHQLNTYASCK